MTCSESPSDCCDVFIVEVDSSPTGDARDCSDADVLDAVFSRL